MNQMNQRAWCALIISAACLGLVFVVLNDDAGVVVHEESNGAAPFATSGLSDEALAKKQKGYKQAVSNAIKFLSEYKLAEKEAVTQKMELNNIQKQRKLKRVVDLHKKAAELEIRRSATEERHSKAQQRSAELSMKIYKRKKKQAQEQTKQAEALTKSAAKDRRAALEEVHLAAAIQTPHAADSTRYAGSSDHANSYKRKNRLSHKTSHAKAVHVSRHNKAAAVVRATRAAAVKSAAAAVSDAKDLAAHAIAHPDQSTVHAAQVGESRASQIVKRSEALAHEAQHLYKRVMSQSSSQLRNQEPSPHKSTTGEDIAKNVVAEIFKDSKAH
jgi:hypothetical protein